MQLIREIHHASLIVADTAEALRFYQGILGLEVLGDRPALSFPGAWLAVGTGQIHLLELPNPDPVENRPPHAGRDRHLALKVSSLDALIVRLDAAGWPHGMSRSGRPALFCRDPDGNGLEFME
ncbi:VOC family protein [Thiocystis violacea]|uniref:VOC family protein n=1 Tax=Thiocystis violacea TaxID=13725 RepID=UPI0019057350|nr:VOC family protein [Thiocystis violacea]MBK1719813.1 glyoxalase [Thiocystis violacea]